MCYHSVVSVYRVNIPPICSMRQVESSPKSGIYESFAIDSRLHLRAAGFAELRRGHADLFSEHFAEIVVIFIPDQL